MYSSNSSRSSGSFPRSLLEKLPNNRILNNSLFVQGQAARLCRHMLPGLIITCARGHLPSGHYYLRSLSLDLQALLLPRFSGPSRGGHYYYLRPGTPTQWSLSLAFIIFAPPGPSYSLRSLLLAPGDTYPVVIITCVHYLWTSRPFSFPDSRDLLEVLL